MAALAAHLAQRGRGRGSRGLGLTDDAKVHVAVHELAHHIGGALEPHLQLRQLRGRF